MNTEKTKVIFRKWKDGDIIALFPEEPGTQDPGTCSSYMHVGQHSAANPAIIRETKPATPDEYRELALELKSIGYNLEIISRNKHKFLYRRARKLRETR